MFGPAQFFSEGIYMSGVGGGPRRYYKSFPWGGVSKSATFGIQKTGFSTNGQVKLEVEYTLDGNNWTTVSITGMDNSSAVGYAQGATSASYGSQARLVLTISGAGGSAIESAEIYGVWGEGSPF